MSTAAGSVTVVLSANSTNFSAALTEAQKNLDKFANKGKAAGHGTVSSMQAASASIRLLDHPMGANIRSIERLISQSKVLSNVLKAAFPLVGAIAIGVMIGRLAGEVAAFITKVREMPKAIEQGFASLSLSAKTSTDQLQLTNDTLQNSINKLAGKPQNNIAIVADEARLAMDKLATSIENSNSKLNELLSKNHLSGWSLLLGKPGTGEREETAKKFSTRADDAAYDLANATTPAQVTAATKKLNAVQTDQLADAQQDLTKRQMNAKNDDGLADEANINIDKGVITTILNQRKQQAAEILNADLEAKNRKAEADKAAAEQSKKLANEAKEAQKKAASEQLQQWESDNSDWKAVQERTLLQDAAWWKLKLDTLTTSSLNYRTVNKKVNAALIANTRETNEAIAKFTVEYQQEFFKTGGLSGDDSKRLTEQGKAAAEYIQSLRTSIDLNKQNADAVAESAIQMAVATGQMTRLDAAQAMAALHTQAYVEALQQLKDQREAISSSPQYDNDPLGRKAALQDNQNRIDGLNGARTLQVRQDHLATNPGATSAGVGFTDALDDFVLATRDAAGQMRQLTDSTLSSLNSEFVKGISGQRTSFGDTGAGIFRNVAGAGIQKAEGSILSAFGFGSSGQAGSKSNPLYVRMADSVTGVASAVGLGIAGKAGGFFKSFFGALPGFAGGGPISAGTLAMVGERGPELLQMGSQSGHITPNHQLTSMSAYTGGDVHFHPGSINAQGSTNPAQTAAMIQDAIRQATPGIINAGNKSRAAAMKNLPPSRRS